MRSPWGHSGIGGLVNVEKYGWSKTFRLSRHCKIIYRTAKTIYLSKPPEDLAPVSRNFYITHTDISHRSQKPFDEQPLYYRFFFFFGTREALPHCNIYTISFTVHCTTTKRKPSKLDLLQSRSKFHGDRVPLLQEVSL